MYQTSSNCAVMTETAAININVSFRAADLALDNISLAVVLYTHGTTYQPTVLTFSNLRSFKRGLNSSFLARHCCLLLLDCFTLRPTVVFILVFHCFMTC